MEEKKDLKTFAKEAKFRFKHGFWKKYNEDKDEKIKIAQEKGFSKQDAIKIQTDKARREIKMQFERKTADDILYEKVVEMLSSDEIVLNPIKRLINEEEYASLDESNKQLYILNLTTKYNQFKERYNKEKILG